MGIYISPIGNSNQLYNALNRREARSQNKSKGKKIEKQEQEEKTTTEVFCIS